MTSFAGSPQPRLSRHGKAPADSATLEAKYGVQLSWSWTPLRAEIAAFKPAPISRDALPLTKLQAVSLEAVRRKTSGLIPAGFERQTFDAEFECVKQAIAADVELRDVCLAQLRQANTAECSDRGLMVWQNLKAAWLQRQGAVEGWQFEQVFSMCLRLRRLAKADQYAAQGIQTLRQTLLGSLLLDDVDARVRVREHMRDALQLPIPVHVSKFGNSLNAGSKSNVLSAAALALEAERIQVDELKDRGADVVDFMLDSESVTHFLSQVPGVRRLIEQSRAHRDAICNVITERMTSMSTDDINDDLRAAEADHEGRRVDILRFALTDYMGTSETDVERSADMLLLKQSARLVPAIGADVQGEHLRPDWKHPVGRWNWMHVAAVAGDAVLVQQLAVAQVPMVADVRGDFPIHLVPGTETVGAVRTIAALADAGADLRAGDAEDRSALDRAVLAADVDSLRALMQHGASPERAAGPNGTTPLHLAASIQPAGYPSLLAMAASGGHLDTHDHAGEDVMNVLDRHSPSRFAFAKRAEFRQMRESLRALALPDAPRQ